MQTRLRAAAVLAPLLGVLLMLAGCGNVAAGGPAASSGGDGPRALPSGDPHGPPNILPAGADCPRPGRSDARTMIDYVDFVQVNGRQYTRFGPVRVTPGVRVGERLGVVRCRLQGSGASPEYSPADGDAAFLSPGTEVFALRNQPVSKAVAVRLGDGYVLYRAMPAAGPGRGNLPPAELSGPLDPTS